MMKGIEIIDDIVNERSFKISNEQFEIVLRFLEVDSNSNFLKIRNSYKNKFNLKIKYLFIFLNKNISDLRLLNFFLKNKKIVNSLNICSLYDNINLNK
tara:strand:- start:842 stop:1135 length:294 start_codon:yes stop_codon:yes gene_type:complete